MNQISTIPYKKSIFLIKYAENCFFGFDIILVFYLVILHLQLIDLLKNLSDFINLLIR